MQLEEHGLLFELVTADGIRAFHTFYGNTLTKLKSTMPQITDDNGEYIINSDKYANEGGCNTCLYEDFKIEEEGDIKNGQSRKKK